MGYYQLQKKAVLSPPKNGTNTVSRICQELYIDKEIRPGPLSYDTVVDYMKRAGENVSDYEFAMLVRHPEDRLVSMINYYIGKIMQITDLDVAIDKALRYPQEYLYQPQVYYWSPEADIRLFNFNNEFRSMATWLGWPEDKELPRENSGPSIFDREQIKQHPYFDDLMDMFDSDWELWDLTLHHESKNQDEEQRVSPRT